MKAEMKVVIASLVVIALALAAVSGITYSWFSDKDEAVIDVSTATVKFDVVFVVNDSEGHTNIGTVEPMGEGKFGIENMVAQDKFDITTTVTNMSTIDVVYRMYIVANQTPPASDSIAFPVEDLRKMSVTVPVATVGGEPTETFFAGFDSKLIIRDWTSLEKNENPEIPKVTLKANDIEAMSASGLQFEVVVEAYQGNYTTPVTAIIMEHQIGETNVPVGYTDEVAKVAVSDLPDSANGKELNFSIVKENDKIILSASIDGITHFVDPVKVTVQLPGDYSGTNVIYLGTNGEQPTLLENTPTYDDTDDVTTFLFSTTHFSEFMIGAKDVVAIADTENGVGVFTTLPDAISAVQSNGTVVLIKEISIIETIPTKSNYTLNLNGKTIIGDKVRVFHIQSGEVNITGEGSISRINSEQNSSSTIRVGDGWYDDTAERQPVKLTIGKDVTVMGDNNHYGISIMGTNTSLTLDIFGTVNGQNYPAISGNGGNVFKPTTITIEEKAVVAINDSTNPAFYHPQAGTLTVNGTVTGGIEAKAGTININDSATISSNGAIPSHKYNGNGTSSNGYAVAIVYNENYKGPAHLISNNATITGITAYLYDDKSVTETVSIAVKTNDDKYMFDTLELAMKYAPSGSTVELLKDITTGTETTDAIKTDKTLYDYLIVDKKVTLNLNSKNITFLGYGFRVNSGGDLTIEGLGNVTGGVYGVSDYENLPLTARGGKVTIKGGTFISQSCAECIYAGPEDGTQIIINGGTFRSTQPDNKVNGWLLNVSNSGNLNSIIVIAGHFYNYDPTTGDDSSPNNPSFVSPSSRPLPASTVNDVLVYQVLAPS